MNIAKSNLRYELHWPDHAPNNPADITLGYLTIYLNDKIIWGFQRDNHYNGFKWWWINLLEHLTEVLPWIESESWPPNFDPSSHTSIREQLEQLSKEEEDLYEYRYRHDLSFGLQGIATPSLWFIHSNDKMWIATSTETIEVPFHQAITMLKKLGDEICERIISHNRMVETVCEWYKCGIQNHD